MIKIGETKFGPANLRIQRKEDIIKMGGFQAINQHNESLMFSRLIRKLNKKIGRTTLESGLVAKHWQRDPNKGYPKGFNKYFTYDSRYN